ncbi:amino acid adenylation domain-containing protein [Biscogniauxia mediterranea]|nr:amino acid adenylation domain-containing protein [Biscogniauxia mediterranea]
MGSPLVLEGLSALNIVPTRITGPYLLHDLVSSSNNNDIPAIDFLSNRGHRSRISYETLHAAANSLSARISKILGSKFPSTSTEPLIIPVLIPQSPELYIALLAILKSGGAFCPLNLDAPSDRVRFILQDVNAKVVLASSDLVSKVPAYDNAYQVLSIDKLLEQPSEEASFPYAQRNAKGDDLAYVMYTSGSTGTPKGVGISHFAATQALLAHDRHIPPFKRFLQFAAPTFDVSVFEIFFPLFRGKTLVCSSRAEMLTDLPAVLRKLDVDACELTPSVAGSLLKRRDNAPCLRLLLTIGEMLTEPVLQEFCGDQIQDSMLWGMYGPTEATIHCTLQPAFKIETGVSSIGIPLDTVSAFVIDTSASVNGAFEFKPVPVGEIGELAVGGYQLATGYINRPEQTATAFINTAWGRVYRTGDKARMRPDGTIECLGRIGGGQVKLNGQRLELGEIEHAILRVPGCHSAFATVISNTLVAFAAVEEVTGMQQQILTRCKAWLPSFMVPSEIRIMESFPRLPSGKVDRRRLIQEYEDLSTIPFSDTQSQFEDDLELQLCQLASELLGSTITPSTRLSSARLDSLAAIEYASMLRAMDISISPLEILGATTLRNLRHMIRNMKPMVCIPGSTDININIASHEEFLDLSDIEESLKPHVHEIERVERCTSLQESMIVETLKDPRLYVNQIEISISTSTTADVIRSWIFDLAQGNEILRTGFAYHNDRLCQIIWNKLDENQVRVGRSAGAHEYMSPQTFLRRPLEVEIIPPDSSKGPHSILLTLHHAIYDGWTTDLLIEDLTHLVGGNLPVDRPQFRNVSSHLAEARETEILASKEFWAEHLHGSHSIPFPNFKTTAVPFPGTATMRKDIRTDPRILEDIAFQSSMSPQVIFQACIAWLWGAVNGIEDVTFGTVSSGRTLPVVGIEKTMGPCVATLPLRVNLRRSRTISDLLQSIHTANREALRHTGLPLADIKRAAGFPIASKLFDLIFAYQETLVSRRKKTALVTEVGHKDAVEAALLIEIQPFEGHYMCQITWHTDLFSEAQVCVFSEQLESLVDYFTCHTEATLDNISRCFPSKYLSLYNIQPRCIETFASLSELVENTASRYPTNEALCFATMIGVSSIESQVLTYDALNSRANQIAYYLQHVGATPGETIAIVMDKSPLLYCCILGILKAGCAYLPMLPSTPLQRILLILEQAQPRFCLTDNDTPFSASDATPCTIVDIGSEDLSGLPDSNIEVQGDPSHLAYIIYTSGTTGTPKGVSISNKNMLSNIEVLSNIYPHSPTDRMLQACSQAFDVSVFEIFFAWGNGMCLCSAVNDTLFEDFERAVRALKVTHLSMTVTVASLLNPCNVPDVKFLVTSGEPMTDEVLEKWAEHLYQVRKVTRGDSSQFLGHSFENTSTFVFFPESTDLAPIGCVGELCFGGDQVSPGYLKMPEATAVKFFHHPHYGRLYRSGDLGRMLPDGSLIILGRLDNQVKLRGLRIELQEIQAVIFKTGLARACTSVLINRRNSNNQQLASFYVPVSHESTKFGFLTPVDSTKEAIMMLHQTLQAALPDYMVPAFIFPISTLPLTSSGKVDNAFLRRSVENISDDVLNMCSSLHDNNQESTEWTWTESMIATVLSDVLLLDKQVISRWSSFATMGLDSISAMPLSRKLQALLHRRVPLSLILQNPNIGRLAAAISQQDATVVESPSREASLLPQSLVEAVRMLFTGRGSLVSNVLPSTPLQEAMLTSSPLSEGVTSSYYNQMLFRIHIPSLVMMDYWNAMFQRHEILRTCFVTTDDVRHPTVQVVLESFTPTWKTFETNIKLLPQLASQHMSMASIAIDHTEPPLSLAIIHTQDSGEYLSFVCHHAIYDGISMHTLLSEIEAMHHRRDLSPPLSFEVFLRHILQPPSGQDEFWAENFRGFTAPRLKEDAIKESSDQTTVITSVFDLPFTLIECQLKALGISLLSVCQTAWAITLSLLHGRSDVCFGNVTSGRSIDLDGIDTLVAPCFNTIPVRVDLSRSKLLVEVMKKLQSFNIDMIPYQFTSLRRIHSQLSPQSRLFDTVFILQPHSEPLDGSIWSLESESGAMDVPIVCETIPSREDDILRIQLHRDPSLFSHQTLMLIQDIFLYVFDICLNHPLSHTSSLTVLPSHLKEQASQLRSEVNHEETQATTSVIPDDEEEWSQVELQVRAVLSKLTNVPKQAIQRHTPIYRYGLDSIASVQLATLLRREDLPVSAVDVIENPTCAGIAVCILRGEQDSNATAYDFDGFRRQVSNDLAQVEGLPAKLDDVLPCTPTQQGMISQFLVSEGKFYFNYASWSLDSELDLQHVADSWTRLAARHQILRTGFIPVSHPDSSFAMVIYPEVEFRAPVTFQQSNTFDSKKWHADCSLSALHELSRPPWRVAIVTDESEVSTERRRATMHISIHHALYDAFSLRGLLDDLAAIVLCTDHEKDRSYIRPALAHLFTPELLPQLSEDFWTSKADELVVNRFPIMTPVQRSDHVPSSTNRTCSISSETLRQSASRVGTTPQAVFQTAWTRILSAYLGESSVTFGIAIDGRTSEKARNAMFPMVTTLPVLAQNLASDTELLEHMTRYNASIRRYEHTPLPHIQRWLGRPEGQLFDTLLVYQKSNQDTKNIPWTMLEDRGFVEYAISLEIEESSSVPINFNLTFDTAVLPMEQARILLAQFDALIGSILRPQSFDEDLTTTQPHLFSILPPQFEQLPTPAPLLHQLVEHTAQRIPRSIALEFVDGIGNAVDSRRWTYSELNDMGNRVANMIISQNITPGSIIAICFNKCPEAYFTILGILKAGCAFLSLDPSAPITRQEFILADSKAVTLLVENIIGTDRYHNLPVPVQVVSDATVQAFSTVMQSPSRPTYPSDTCYCLYTSGTTGTPKGCLITHDNAVQAMAAFEQLFMGRWDTDSRCLQFASFHFDVSVLEQYWSWYVGIRLVSAPRDLILSDLATVISRLGITHIDLTPSLARLIHPNEVPSLCKGVFITGGEQLRQEILQTWGPEQVIYNAYGPTEATIGVTMNQRVPANGRPTNIGKQFPNVGSYVFEPGTEIPVLRGGVGELCVSGRLVGKGYLNRQSLTEERFPYLKHNGERVYRTGDLVRVLHDGSFDFLGRADDQVKLRGQRLEIGEINHVIKESLLGRITDVVTLVTRRDKQDRDLLVSFVVPSSVQASPSVNLQVFHEKHFHEISRIAQDACKGRLPGYMVPTYIICIPFIPLSANNKAETKRLKQLFAELSLEELRSLSTGSMEASRPLNEKEQVISQALSKIVPIEESGISPSSTIFQLGLDSITALRLARELWTLGFTSANPSVILRNPQISQLAQALSQTDTNTSTNQVMQIKQLIHALYHKYIGMVCRVLDVDRTRVKYIAPCSPLQEGMIARSRTLGDKSAYFNEFRFELDTDVSLTRLKACFDSATAACPILGTAFLETCDGYIQVAIKDQLIRWTHIHVKGGDIEEAITGRRHQWLQANERQLRHLTEVDHFEHSEKHTLVLRLFHGLYDAYSFELLLRNINREYNHSPPKYGPAFVDMLPNGPLLSHHQSRPFWESLFKDHFFQPMPTLCPNPSPSDSILTQMIQIDGLEERRRALGVAHQTILQAAWLVTLQQYFPSSPTIGVIFSGRSIVVDGVDKVIGPMFNTLPFRVDDSKTPTWASLVHSVHEYNTTVLSFVHTPLRDIQKWCSKGRPLFDILFTFDQDLFADEENGPLESPTSSTGDLDYPLALEAILTRDQKLKITVAAKAGIADDDSIMLLLNDFAGYLQSLAASDDNTPLPTKCETPRVDTATSASSVTSDTYLTVPSTPDTAHPTFTWSKQAHQIQHEIASIAGVEDDEVSEATNLFELGLDSIDIIKLVSRLTRLGFQVSVSDMIRRPTIQSIMLSDDIGNGDSGISSPRSNLFENSIALMENHLRQCGMDFQDIDAVLPPTPIQDSLVADMILSDFQRYFNHDILEILPGTDVDRLKSAWSTVYSSSPILRTRFAEIDDPRVDSAYCQIIEKKQLEFGPPIDICDLSETTAVINRARERAAAGKGTSDLFQLSIATMGDRKFLVLSIAHALYDGWSLDMLHKDVQAAYEGHYTAREQYAPYLERLISYPSLQSEGFWSDFLHGARPTLLEQVGHPPEAATTDVHRSKRESQLSLSDIRAICKNYRITPQILGQGCWAAVLASLSKSLDVTFGVVLSGRETDEAQNLLFPTMNTVPLRVILHWNVTEYLKYLQDIMSSIIEFQHIPLRRAQRFSEAQGDQLFNTLFLLKNVKEQPVTDAPLVKSVHESSAVEYPVCIELELTEQSVVWHIACDERYASSEDTEKVLSDLEVVLHHLSGKPKAEVLDFDVASGRVSICGLEPVTLSNISRATTESKPTVPAPDAIEHSVAEGPLLEVLAELSSMEKHTIGLEQSVFHIGLDSISAIKAVSMLRKRGLNASVRDILQAPSIEHIIKHLSTPINQMKGSSSELSADQVFAHDSLDTARVVQKSRLDPSSVERVLPALPVQVHMLSTWQNTNGSVFFSRFAYKISGQVNHQDISEAWIALVDEIPILRTSFVSTGSSAAPFVQIVSKPGLSNTTAKRISTKIEGGLYEFVYGATPFAFVQIIESRPGDLHLYLHIHHAVYDGVSLPNIIQRLTSLCGSSPTLRSLNHQNAWYNFVLEHNAPQTKAKGETFWTSYLQHGMRAGLLDQQPGSRIHGGQPVAEFQKNVFGDLARLKRLCSEHGITIQALFFAAYSRVLARRRHSRGVEGDNVVFGIYLANRSSLPDLETVPLPTLNILPLRVVDPLKKDIGTLAAEIQKDIFDISGFEHASASLWEIHKWTGVQIDTFVNFLSLPDSPSAIDGGSISISEVPDLESSPTQNAAGVASYLARPDAETLLPNVVRESYYVDAVDIEVAVRSESMDIGVFCPSSRFSSSQAQELIREIISTLKSSS